MPGEDVVKRFLYFYGAYAPKANLNKFMQYSSKEVMGDLLQDPDN